MEARDFKRQLVIAIAPAIIQNAGTSASKKVLAKEIIAWAQQVYAEFEEQEKEEEPKKMGILSRSAQMNEAKEAAKAGGNPNTV